MGVCAGGDDDSLGAAPQNGSAGVDDVGLMQVVAGVRRIAGTLGNCLRFAGEDGLVHRQTGSRSQRSICRHVVACLQPDAVPTHQFPCRNGLPCAVPTDGRCGGGEIAQRFQCLFRAELLKKSQNGVEQDNEDDGDRIGDLPQKGGDSGGCEEDEHHHIPELSEEHADGVEFGGGGEFVFPVLAQAFPCLFGSKTGHRAIPSFSEPAALAN